ncbi:MAG: hypothetical protein CVV18_01540 [Gammaproteobacteria bacterium HGW-Gammaproteobacteria-8]|nr:MAG: hypothetical protein CVV18_01540 [Gammaproteobacteria bacterium HGW-Gammaproteobacteria-8]
MICSEARLTGVKPQPDALAAPLVALINPQSFRMRIRGAAARSGERVRAHGGAVYPVTNLAEIEQALQQASLNGIGRLVLAGGDGTLQGAVSWLARNCAHDALPDLVVLAAGRTNYVADDIGTRRNFATTLDAVLETPVEKLHPVYRHTLECVHPSIPTQQGFFLAGAIVDEAIRHAHREQPRSGHRSGQYAASALSVIRLLSRTAVGRYRFKLPEFDVDAGPLGSFHGPCRFLLATSLPLQAHLVDPYARRGRGELRLTVVSATARHWRARLPRIMLGRFSAGMTTESGYLSGRIESATLSGIERITLDGQEFDLDPSLPLALRTGPCFRFLRP